MALTKRTLLQFRHDRRTLGFVLIMPLLIILMFGYTFGGDANNIEVEVVDLDQGVPAGTVSNLPLDMKFSNQIIDNFDDNAFSIQTATDPAEAKENVDDGNVWAAIIFPANFTQNLMMYLISNQSVTSQRPILEIYIDGSNPTISNTILKTINEAILSAMDQFSNRFNQTSIELPININFFYAYGGEDLEFIDYFAPGVISFAIMMVTTMLTIILFVNEHRNGTLQRLLASPATEGEIVTGYAIAFGLIGILQSIVVLVAAILIFDIIIVGSVMLALFVVLLLAFGHQGLGILLSAAAKNELQAIQFIPIIIFPSILLAGLFWPIESIPEILQPISYFIPLRYCIDATRSVMLRGWGLEKIMFEVLILIIFAILMLSLSVIQLKKRKE
jgi:ABC-2 type transport system permease protein